MFNTGFPPEWSTLKKLIWLVGSGIAGAAKGIWKTVTGTLIHITDALASPMQKCEVSLEPIQDLHGQDAPYPAGGGKNKFPVTLATQEKNGTTFTVSDDGSVKISGTPSELTRVTLSSLSITPSADMKFSMVGEATGVRVFCAKNSSGTTTYPTLTPSTTIEAGTMYSSFLLEVATTFSGTAVTVKFQLEDGTTVTDWSPYSNICPITGWTGCEVTRTGKNLFDKDNPLVINAYLDNGKIISNSSHRTIYIPCKPNTAYTAQKIAVNTSDRFYIAYCNEFPANNVSIYGLTGKGVNFVVGEKYSYSVTTGADAKYIVVWVSTALNYNDSIPTTMIEVGGEASSYSAYSGATLSVTFPATVYGGSHEFVSGDNTKTHNRLTLKDLTWYTYQPLNNGGYRFVAYPFTSESVYPKEGAALTQNISNVFSYINPNHITADTPYYKFGIYSSGTNRFLQITHPAETVADLITSLTELDAILVYEVANPTEISLTPQPISTLAGENNVWSNGDSVEITYKAQA